MPPTIGSFGGGISNSGSISAANEGILGRRHCERLRCVRDISTFAAAPIIAARFPRVATVFCLAASHLGWSSMTISTFSGRITNSGLITAGIGILVGSAFRVSPAPSSIPAPSSARRRRNRRRQRGKRDRGRHHRRQHYRGYPRRRDRQGDTLNFAVGTGRFTYSITSSVFRPRTSIPALWCSTATTLPPP